MAGFSEEYFGSDEDSLSGSSCTETSFDDSDLSLENDPVLICPDHFLKPMFDYLSNDELLSAISVSPSWKRYILSSDSLMKRLMDNFIAHPNIEGLSLSQLDAIFGPDKRRYKHMKTEFPSYSLTLNRKIYSVVYCYAETLETLEITCHDGIFMARCDFPNLKSLKLRSDSLHGPSRNRNIGPHFKILRTFNMPQLENLEIYAKDEHFRLVRYEEFIEVLRGMPKLKNFATLNKCFDEWFVDHTHDSDQQLPAIERISMNTRYAPRLVRNFQKSLEEAEFDSMYLGYFFSAVGILKSLTCLSMSTLKVDNYNYNDNLLTPPNESIRILRICSCEVESVIEFRRMVDAVPSLRELYIDKLSEEKILYLALQMPFLVKVVVKTVDDVVRSTYRRIRRNPLFFVNSFFQLYCDRSRCFRKTYRRNYQRRDRA